MTKKLSIGAVLWPLEKYPVLAQAFHLLKPLFLHGICFVTVRMMRIIGRFERRFADYIGGETCRDGSIRSVRILSSASCVRN